MIANATAIDKDHPIKSVTYSKAKKIQKQRIKWITGGRSSRRCKNEKFI